MSDIVKRMRALEVDHGPDSWPAVQMGDVSALCSEIEQLRAALTRIVASHDAHYTMHASDGDDVARMIEWAAAEDAARAALEKP